jgi:hypothetical protein
MVVPKLKMNSVHDNVISHHIEKCLEDFFVLHASRLEEMIEYQIFFKRCAIESSIKTV